MPEITTPPIIRIDKNGDPTYTFSDVARWIISEGGDDDVMVCLKKNRKKVK